MRVRDFIQAAKTVTKAGQWKSEKMPRTAFPLVGTKSLRLPATWTWRVDELEGSGGADCRLLIAIREDVEQCRAWLSVRRGRDFAVVARIEYHATHPGWHCHAECGNVDDVPVGVVRSAGQRRLPHAQAFHRDREAAVTKLDARNIAYRLLRIESMAGDLI